MRDEDLRPFESIESALEFIVLLESVIREVTGELETRRAQSRSERYMDGLNLAMYKVHQLLFHVQKSQRILNDLRLIRTVLAGRVTVRAAEAAGDGNDALPSAMGAWV